MPFLSSVDNLSQHIVFFLSQSFLYQMMQISKTVMKGIFNQHKSNHNWQRTISVPITNVLNKRKGKKMCPWKKCVGSNWRHNDPYSGSTFISWCALILFLFYLSADNNRTLLYLYSQQNTLSLNRLETKISKNNHLHTISLFSYRLCCPALLCFYVNLILISCKSGQILNEWLMWYNYGVKTKVSLILSSNVS